MLDAARPGLDLLATAVVMVDDLSRVFYANPAAENLFEMGARQLKGHTVGEIFVVPERRDIAVPVSVWFGGRARSVTRSHQGCAK